MLLQGVTNISVSPVGKYFINNYPQLNEPPVSVLRDLQGKMIVTLEKTNISKLMARSEIRLINKDIYLILSLRHIQIYIIFTQQIP